MSLNHNLLKILDFNQHKNLLSAYAKQLGLKTDMVANLLQTTFRPTDEVASYKNGADVGQNLLNTVSSEQHQMGSASH